MFSRPPVYALVEDIPHMRSLVQSSGAEAPGAALFAEEFKRFCVLSDRGEAPFVRPGSWLTYRDLRTKQERRVCLRPPQESQQPEDVDMLSPLGAALIGLLEGAVFRWSEPSGKLRAVQVINIEA